jgi:hypothetical protein
MHVLASGSTAEWVGAVGQILTAVLAASIAYLAFRHTDKTMQMTCQRELHDMVNNWNRMVIYSEATIKAVGPLREPVLGYPDDSIIFSYLNFLRANFEGSKAGLISRESERVAIGNGVNWLSKLGRPTLESFLKRGYGTEFRDRILAEFDRITSAA